MPSVARPAVFPDRLPVPGDQAASRPREMRDQGRAQAQQITSGRRRGAQIVELAGIGKIIEEQFKPALMMPDVGEAAVA